MHNRNDGLEKNSAPNQQPQQTRDISPDDEALQAAFNRLDTQIFLSDAEKKLISDWIEIKLPYEQKKRSKEEEEIWAALSGNEWIECAWTAFREKRIDDALYWADACIMLNPLFGSAYVAAACAWNAKGTELLYRNPPQLLYIYQALQSFQMACTNITIWLEKCPGLPDYPLAKGDLRSIAYLTRSESLASLAGMAKVKLLNIRHDIVESWKAQGKADREIANRFLEAEKTFSRDKEEKLGISLVDLWAVQFHRTPKTKESSKNMCRSASCPRLNK